MTYCTFSRTRLNSIKTSVVRAVELRPIVRNNARLLLSFCACCLRVASRVSVGSACLPFLFSSLLDSARLNQLATVGTNQDVSGTCSINQEIK